MSAARFADAHASWYWVVVAASVVYVAISLAVNLFTSDDCAVAHRRRVDSYAPDRWASVDVLLPICGEPLEVLQNTWSHVARLSWPGVLNVYVLDDGADPAAAALAQRVGFQYLTRPDRGRMKKAGNLRFGFGQTSGEFFAVFDADFCPRPDFLRELIPYMSDDVGIVQSPQYFRVHAEQGWLERGAGAVQEFFYRAVQVSREQRGGAICVGSNAIYRRAALEANGGTTLIEHSEDVHTGFDVRQLGWRLRYVPVNLAAGLCPALLSAFFRQQYRWCMGSMSLLGSTKFWRASMSPLTRCCYVSGFCYYAFTAAFTVIFPLVPLLLLLAYPGAIRLENYLLLAPGLIYGFIIFPLWHRCRYGVEAWTVKLVYGWAHLFALIDLARGRPMSWQPTGMAGGRDRRNPAFLRAAVLWSGGTAVLWSAAALSRLATSGRPLDFVPAMALGLFYTATVARMFAPTRRSWPVGYRLRLAAFVALLSIVLAAPAAARAAPLPAGGMFGVVANERDFPSWRSGLGAMTTRMTFQAWSAKTDPRALLAADRRFGTTPIISWEPWRPPPLGSDDQGAAQPRYSNAAIASGRWDHLLERWARAARDFKRPVGLRFAHEMQGFWYPWSRDPDSYRAAWRHMWRVFRRQGARNVIWIWSVNSDIGRQDSALLSVIAPYWPGARYVDAVGTTAVTFDGIYRPAWFIERLKLVARAYDKPAMLTEVNVEYRARQGWLRELRDQLLSERWVRGLIWSQATSRGARRNAVGSLMDQAAWKDPAARSLLRSIRRALRDREP